MPQPMEFASLASKTGRPWLSTFNTSHRISIERVRASERKRGTLSVFSVTIDGVQARSSRTKQRYPSLLPFSHLGKAVGDVTQKANMAVPAAGQAKNRRALRDIGNLVLPAIRRPVARCFCAQLPATSQRDAPENKKTLTSTMTARSKAACGLNYKSKPANVVDIDAQDMDNELAEVEYVEDIYKFYKLAENENQVHDYMHSQPEINDKTRAILIDWLIEVHDKFELTNETLYLTINIVDRFLAAETVAGRELQCMGMSAMLIASKYEEIWALEVNDFVKICNRAYDHRDVLVMEKRILGRLEWNLTLPTPYVFLTRFIKAAATPPEINMEHMVFFYAELGMMNYEIIRFCPSMVAAAAVYAARSTLNQNPVWHETLEMHTGFAETKVMECAKMMALFHSMAKNDQKREVIYRKYSSVARGAVALYPPANSLLASVTPLSS
ncbi:hypothetical protein L1887_29043 [Cichorium endivia]|nr:hypothetical protein L1887_29043 [Cichorium endivia]